MESPPKTSPVIQLSRPEQIAIGATRRAMNLAGIIAPRAVAALGVRFFTSPRRHTPPAYEQEIATTAERLTVSYRGLNLAAQAWGTGPVVLLVHGWEGRGAQLGRFMPPLANAGYRVIALDGPAHGASDGDRTQVIDMAGAIRAAAENFGPVHGVVAHSFGGAATLIAIRQGFRPRRVVLVGVPEALDKVIERFNTIFRLSPRLMTAFYETLERGLGRPIAETNFSRGTVPHEVAGLLIHDRGDTEVPFTEGEAIHRAWPAARFLATEGLGHRRILKDPAVIQTSVAFLQGADTSVLPSARH